MNSKELPCKTIGELYAIHVKKFQRQYKNGLAINKNGIKNPYRRLRAFYWKPFDDLSLDEVALCNGELYTALTPKKKGKKESIIIIVRNQV